MHTANSKSESREEEERDRGPVSRGLAHEDASVREIKTKNSASPPSARALPLFPSSERASYSAAEDTGLPAASSMGALLPVEALGRGRGEGARRYVRACVREFR